MARSVRASRRRRRRGAASAAPPVAGFRSGLRRAVGGAVASREGRASGGALPGNRRASAVLSFAQTLRSAAATAIPGDSGEFAAPRLPAARDRRRGQYPDRAAAVAGLARNNPRRSGTDHRRLEAPRDHARRCRIREWRGALCAPLHLSALAAPLIRRRQVRGFALVTV